MKEGTIKYIFDLYGGIRMATEMEGSSQAFGRVPKLHGGSFTTAHDLGGGIFTPRLGSFSA